jgi:hypothetical protein
VALSPALKARFVLAGRLVALAVAVGLVAKGPHLVWLILPAKSTALVIVDKTVAHDDYREHRALTWMLRALKVKRADGTFYETGRDYVGFDPATRTGRDLRAADLASADAVFITDTYGVYVADYKDPGDREALDRSRRLYGGMTASEAAVVDDFSARGGLVIAEFNTLASPTPDDARARLESVLGFKWTRWVGRYWSDLADDTEVPAWLLANYERLYGKPLDRQGAALVFVRDDEDIVVMRTGVDLRADEALQIERVARPDDAELARMPASARYDYWLDVVAPTDSDVLFEHVVQATDDGVLRMEKHGIPLRFPALLRRRGERKVYYFAGDFIDTPAELGDPDRAGILWWKKITHGDPEAEGNVFWAWYAPIVAQILEPRFHSAK